VASQLPRSSKILGNHWGDWGDFWGFEQNFSKKRIFIDWHRIAADNKISQDYGHRLPQVSHFNFVGF
jgi:hypothetical protein